MISKYSLQKIDVKHLLNNEKLEVEKNRDFSHRLCEERYITHKNLPLVLAFV